MPTRVSLFALQATNTMPIRHPYARSIVSIAGAIFFLLLGLFGFVVLAKLRPQPTRRPESIRTYSVETIRAERSSFRERIVAYGTAQAVKSARLASRVSGQVASLREGLRSGLWVAAGEELISLDKRPFEAEVARRKGVNDQSVAELAKLAVSEAAWRAKKEIAERDLELAKTDYDRALELIEKGVVSARERDVKETAFKLSERNQIETKQRYDELLTEIDRAKAAVDQSEASLRQAELDLEFATIRAPFDGVVQKVRVERGEVVSSQSMGGNSALLELVATREVEVPVQLPASLVSDLTLGQGARLTLPSRPGVEWLGKVARISPTIDSANRSIEVYVVVENDESDARADLLPGTFTMAELEGRAFDDVIAVPRRAIVDGKCFVVIQEEWATASGREKPPADADAPESGPRQVKVARERRPCRWGDRERPRRAGERAGGWGRGDSHQPRRGVRGGAGRSASAGGRGEADGNGRGGERRRGWSLYGRALDVRGPEPFRETA
jgi:multidrug efflux pump subunit AcrA (membrane-fusion protein)